ncbi:E3 ubiquitin-protein ligase NEURL1B [Porphyridium purpureum]|uniref:E3 ubiquitin-protein ligase NEURL1B n=1 Tax=Porphyridium purpureum TaxID=35688 RepID=A0A5J4Z8U4_PORPP|nr:E3 ubiquitin-protein ligase NEURL1B [Porphyridium purpureum]|eukprot:POR3612..scf295_1
MKYTRAAFRMPGQPLPAGSPRSTGDRTAALSSSVYLKTHVQEVLELWKLREQARVQRAELHALSRILESAVQKQRSRCEGFSNVRHVCLERVQQFEQQASRSQHAEERVPQASFQPRGRLHAFAESTPHDVEMAEADSFGETFLLERGAPNSDSSWITLNSPTDDAFVQHLRRDPWIDVLHSQRNVTQALDSEFRHELEHALAQVSNMGRDTVMDLPYYRRRRRRRTHGAFELEEDLSEPITSEGEHEQLLRNADEVEHGIGRTPASVLEELKHEIETLKNMIHASFDVQLDVQRAVRQEVAAAMGGAAQYGGHGGSSSSRSGSSLDSQVMGPTFPGGHGGRVRTSGTCIVCIEAQIDSVFYACGHNATCTLCARKLLASGQPCPMCRAPIKDVIRVFGFTLVATCEQKPTSRIKYSIESPIKRIPSFDVRVPCLHGASLSTLESIWFMCAAELGKRHGLSCAEHFATVVAALRTAASMADALGDAHVSNIHRRSVSVARNSCSVSWTMTCPALQPF